MALEKLGLSAILTIDTRGFVLGVRQARTAFSTLGASSQSARTNLMKATRAARAFKQSISGFGKDLKRGRDGLESLGMASLPVAAGMGFGVVKAAKYEQQLSNLRSVMGDISENEFVMLESRARELGMTTVFTATQSAEAMENMRRMGFSTQEVMAGIKPVMDTAAVAGIELADAANLVGGSTRAMGLEVKEAARIADVLTVASQESASTVPELAEALSYGASGALKWGMSVEDTVAVLGKLADRMHKGSTGGMLLMNVVNALTNATPKAKKQLDAWGISLSDAKTGKMRPFMEVIDQIRGKLDLYKDDAKRARIQGVLFQQRASRAFAALSASGSESVNKLSNVLVNSFGAAEKAAKIRLDNIIGSITLFMSAVESISIAMFKPFLAFGKQAFDGVAASISNVVKAMEFLEANKNMGESFFLGESIKQFGRNATETAIGIKAALDNVKAGFMAVGNALKTVMSIFGNTNSSAVELVATVLMFSVVLGPAALAVRGLSMVLGGMIGIFTPLVSGLGVVASAIKFAFVTNIGSAGTMINGFIATKLTPFIGFLKTLNAGLLFTAASIALPIAALAYFGYKLVENKREGQSWLNYWMELAGNIEQVMHSSLTRVVAYVKDAFAAMIRPFAKLAVFIADLSPGGKKLSQGLREFAKGSELSNIQKAEQEIKRRERYGRAISGSQIANAAKQQAKTEAKGMFDIQSEMKKAVNAAVGAAQNASDAAGATAEAAKRKPCAQVNLDGREVGRSVSKVQESIRARDGKSTHWQRRRALENGAVPVGV